ncbi:UNVERIFIED_CONTAM: hypothetical protein Sradi_3302900 [Sesamum radiatum]|uniref:MULE transposase domain-containing protein n=1 Tax=Sesamum radiatum TaxID=300843 RepID=A0AAW2R0Y9_SESRA
MAYKMQTTSPKYDIIVHYKDSVTILKDRHSKGCEIDASNRMTVCDDDDVATMFEMYKVSKKINLYAANDLENVEGGNEEGSEEGAIEEGVEGDDDDETDKDAEGCSWRVHASPLPDGETFMIKTLENKHTCVRADKIKEASASWMTNKLIDVLRENPDMKARGLRNEVRKFGVTLPNMKLYRAKKMTIDIIEGGHASSYGLLSAYAKMVEKTNLDSLLKLQYHTNAEGIESVPGTLTFKRIFIGLDALKHGFLHGCNPFLGLDGCHLKGPYGGVLLAAIDLDGNNGLFPMAYAVVEGLVECISELVPNAVNRKCCRHIYANFRQQFVSMMLKKYFWQAARSYTVSGFNFAMFKLKEPKPATYEWLKNIPVHMWARHAFDVRLKNDHDINNLSESFNNWVGDLRSKSILSLVDGLRAKIMSRLHKRFQKGCAMQADIPLSQIIISMKRSRNQPTDGTQRGSQPTVDTIALGSQDGTPASASCSKPMPSELDGFGGLSDEIIAGYFATYEATCTDTEPSDVILVLITTGDH